MAGGLNRREFLMRGGRLFCLAAAGSVLPAYFNAACLAGNEYYLKTAIMWDKLPGKTVQCTLCPNSCRLEDGERGICRARKNIGGTLYSTVYSRIAAAHVDPIEKKPFFHFLPGTAAYSVGTAGCNLSCRFCQNWELSQADPEELDALQITPEKLLAGADKSGSKVIAFTYNEPTVQAEYIIDSSALARKKGLRSVIVSNGYILPEAGRALVKNLDAVKIDLKAFTENFYSSICGGSLKPVQENLVSLHGTGKWLEIVVLVIPSLNDSPAEIRSMCRWIRSSLSENVPVHFTRFHAMYKMQNLPPTPVSTLERCRSIASDAGIRYPYIGNVAGHKWENTWCHSCGKLLINRSGFFHVENHIRNGLCPYCSAKIPGIWS